MQTLVKKMNEFNQSKDYELFKEIMDILYPNAVKCKDCKKHILYYDTIFVGHKRLSKKTGNLNIRLAGKSFLTKKTHGENLCVCEECLKKIFPKYKPGRTFNTITDITTYAFNIQDRTQYFAGITKEKCIKKYGREYGLLIWDNYRKRQAETNTYEYKAKKYNMSKKEFDSFNKSRAVTLNNLIKKYGEIEGTEKWNSYIERQRETKSQEYMINKFGPEKTELINKSKGITLDNYIKKYGKEKGTNRYIKIINKQPNFFSKISQEFFNKLDVFFNKKYTTYYATKNTEYGVNLSIGYIKLDYFIKELNLCIEFNGDIFHANPKIFSSSDTPNPYNKELIASDIWKIDNLRYTALKNEKNIDTLIIWQSDYKTLNINDFINNIVKRYGILF